MALKKFHFVDLVSVIERNWVKRSYRCFSISIPIYPQEISIL